MTSLPTRHDLQSDLNPSPIPNNVIPLTLPQSVDLTHLKDLALRSTHIAMLQLIQSIQNPDTSDAVKNRAAEAVLNVAFGKDKQELRSTEDTKDAVAAIAEAIRQAKEA